MESEMMTADEIVADAVSVVHDILMSDALSPTHKAALERVFQLLVTASKTNT